MSNPIAEGTGGIENRFSVPQNKNKTQYKSYKNQSTIRFFRLTYCVYI
jgi:hypothetical protein